jgi:hypothetical protein
MDFDSIPSIKLGDGQKLHKSWAAVSEVWGEQPDSTTLSIVFPRPPGGECKWIIVFSIILLTDSVDPPSLAKLIPLKDKISDVGKCIHNVWLACF